MSLIHLYCTQCPSRYEIVRPLHRGCSHFFLPLLDSIGDLCLHFGARRLPLMANTGYAILYRDVENIPARFPTDIGIAQVPEHYLALKFGLQIGTIMVERETRDLNNIVLYTTLINPSMCSSSKIWILDIFESIYYRVMGQDDSRSLATISTIPAFRDSSRQTASSSKEQELFKTEVFELSDDDGVDDCCILGGSTPTFHNGKLDLVSQPSSSVPATLHPMPPRPSAREPLFPSLVVSDLNPLQFHSNNTDVLNIPCIIPRRRSIIDLLRTLKSRSGSRSELSTLNYNNIEIQQVKFLPQVFNGDIIFEMPLFSKPSGGGKTWAGALEGMDRRHDGHAWTTTYTSNINLMVQQRLRWSVVWVPCLV